MALNKGATVQALNLQLAQRLSEDGVFETEIPELSLIRCSEVTARSPVIYQPSLYVVAQGQKQAYLGEEVYRYDALNYLVLPVAMPLQAHVIKASKERPYLALRLKLDIMVLSDLLVQMHTPLHSADGTARGLFVSPMEEELGATLLRLIDCLDESAQVSVLAPLIIKEVLFHLLRGKQGDQLRTFAQRHRHHHQIARVLQHILSHYDRPLEVNELASLANMSHSSLHHYFKLVTGLSPIQYVKVNRLHQARRLLNEGRTVSDAAFEVGYASLSQFSREYKRLFGAPPSRDPRRPALVKPQLYQCHK
jgi:AraC-like DNA-binding protein